MQVKKDVRETQTVRKRVEEIHCQCVFVCVCECMCAFVCVSVSYE